MKRMMNALVKTEKAKGLTLMQVPVPEPGKVTLDVEANSKGISGLPAFSQAERMSINGIYSPLNS